MYAIIATGGKQYKVAEGDIIKVEKLNAEEGSEVSFDVVAVNTDKDVLCGDACKKSEKKKQGHRQPFTQVKIEAINA